MAKWKKVGAFLATGGLSVPFDKEARDAIRNFDVREATEKAAENARVGADRVGLPAKDKATAENRAKAKERRAERTQRRDEERLAAETEQTREAAEAARYPEASFRCVPVQGVAVADWMWRSVASTLSLDRSGISVTDRKGRRTLELAWEQVADLRAEDASRTQVKSRVQQKAAGGIWSPIGTTAPVSRIDSKEITRAVIVIEARDQEYRYAVRTGIHEVKQQFSRVKSRYVTTVEAGRTDDPVAQLERLGKLREMDVLSEAEFDAKKAELLKRI